MSTLDKVVKSACKPKSGPPKSKYLDTLVAATYSDDGSLQDIIRSLSLRLREPNSLVVLKGLITLHTLLRTGQTENLLSHLQNDQLRLRNVAAINWEGTNRPPSNMGAYAIYIDSRAKCYKELQHDAVRTQSESNRRGEGLGAGSKARRLRHLSVDKGLLREVRSIQKVLDALVVCRFYEDDLHDECTVVAFRMCVKDLLILFQAGNEGVCNILEHYFEMSKSDATEALAIYKSFIAQTDRVVDYLGMAKRLHNVVNVPVPNLKHAPTGLVKALDEYLNDPNFEQNRIEYKRSLGVVEGKGGRSSPEKKGPSPAPATSANAASSSSTSALKSEPVKSAPSVSTAPAQSSANQKIQDFFESIQTDQQPTMFGGPATNAFQQQQMMPMFTGMPMMQAPWGNPGQMQSPQGQINPFRQSMMMPQQTGFLQPQMTGQMAFGGAVGGMPFMQPQRTGFNPALMQPQPQMQPQATGLLQPQATGANPFRQSMMMTGGGMGGGSPFGQQQPQQQQQSQHPFGAAGQHALSQPTSPFKPQATGMGGMPGQAQGQGQGQGMTPFGSLNQTGTGIQRPGSTPALSINTAFGANANANPNSGAQNGKAPQPLTAQPTGTKNPFAPAGGMPAPPVPKGPSMNDLAASKYATFSGMPNNANPGNGTGAGAFGASAFGGLGQGLGQGQGGSAGDAGPNGMGGIASAFAFDGGSASKSPSTSSGNDWLSQFGALSVNTGSSTNTGTSTNGTGTGFGTTNGSSTPATSVSGLSAFNTGTGSLSSPSRAHASSPFGAGTGAAGFLQPQRTGFGGSTVKPFKPTSSFGSTLMETLPEGAAAGSGSNAQAQQQAQAQRPSLMSFDSDPAPSAGANTAVPAGGNGGGGFAGANNGGVGSFGAASSNQGQGGQQGAFGQFGQMGQNQGQAGQGQGANVGTNSMFGQGQGLVPNMTGAPNPFRQSTMGMSGFGGTFGAGQGGQGGMSFGSGAFGGQQQQQQKQQHGLI